jgi:hypothetical protein
MGLLAELVLLNAGPSWTHVSVAGQDGWIPSINRIAITQQRCGILLSGEPLSTERALAAETAVMAEVHAAERENHLRQRGWKRGADGWWTTERRTPPGRHSSDPDFGYAIRTTDRAIVLEACNAMQRWLDRRNAPVPYALPADEVLNEHALLHRAAAKADAFAVPYDG